MSALRAVKRRLYAFSLIDEIGPLYAVYTLLFLDNGLSASQISTVFVIWAAVAIALEIPSGAVADMVDRRLLVAIALGLRAVGITVWLIEPSYAGALLGATLWALHTSLASGAWEALVHDELAAVDAEDRYAPVMARVGQFSNLGIAAGTIIATAALSVGGSIELLGWITVAIHALSIQQVVALPDVRWVSADQRDSDETDRSTGAVAEWRATMRDGLGEIASSRTLVGLVVVTAVLEGLFVVDEYVPLLARDRGADDAVVPLLVLAVWVGLLAGGEIAARRPRLSPVALGSALAVGAALMAIAVQGESLGLLVLIGVGYAAHEAIWVLGDARLQERIGPRRRATVTSVRSFLAGILATLAFLTVGALSSGDDPRPGLLAVIAVLAVTAVAATRLVPPAKPAAEQATEPTDTTNGTGPTARSTDDGPRNT